MLLLWTVFGLLKLHHCSVISGGIWHLWVLFITDVLAAISSVKRQAEFRWERLNVCANAAFKWFLPLPLHCTCVLGLEFLCAGCWILFYNPGLCSLFVFFLLQHELLICPVYGSKIYSPSLAWLWLAKIMFVLSCSALVLLFRRAGSSNSAGRQTAVSKLSGFSPWAFSRAGCLQTQGL